MSPLCVSLLMLWVIDPALTLSYSLMYLLKPYSDCLKNVIKPQKPEDQTLFCLTGDFFFSWSYNLLTIKKGKIDLSYGYSGIKCWIK